MTIGGWFAERGLVGLGCAITLGLALLLWLLTATVVFP